MVILGPHPNPSDYKKFYHACQIDPLFDSKYSPKVEEALENVTYLGDYLGGNWTSLIDPNDEIFYFQKKVGAALDFDMDSDTITNLTWEHPRIPNLRDSIQDEIAADHAREQAMLKALEPKLSPEEEEEIRIRKEKRMVAQSIELVSLELKDKFGNPEIDDVSPKPDEDYWTANPFEVMFAAKCLGINLTEEDRQINGEEIEYRYIWTARMAANTPLEKPWIQGPPIYVEEEDVCYRQYRDDTWDDSKLYVREPPGMEYWRLVLECCRMDDDDDDADDDYGDDDDDDVEGSGIDERRKAYDTTEYNKFASKKSGREYFFDYDTQLKTFVDGGQDEDDELEEEEGGGELEKKKNEEEEEKEKEEEEEEKETQRQSKLNFKQMLIVTHEDVLRFGRESKIPPREIENNPKLATYLKNTLLQPLEDDWKKARNPDGKVFYYRDYSDSDKKEAIWYHPLAPETEEKYKRGLEKRKEFETKQRLQKRQTLALERSLEKTRHHSQIADLIARNQRKGAREKIVLSLGPQEEALEFYTKRYGPPNLFLKKVQEVVVREMYEADDDMQITPEQVVQMGLYFGMKQNAIVEESFLLGAALCALYAPLPPFWHVIGFEEERNKIREERKENLMNRRTTIDFALSEGEAIYAEEEFSSDMLLFARDKVGGEKYTQSSHPSDEYWRAVFDSAREHNDDEGNIFFSDALKERCSVLPFVCEVGEGIEGGSDYEGLWWYDFSNCVAILSEDYKNVKRTKFPRLGRRHAMGLTKQGEDGTIKKKRRASSIFKFEVPETLRAAEKGEAGREGYDGEGSRTAEGMGSNGIMPGESFPAGELGVLEEESQMPGMSILNSAQNSPSGSERNVGLGGTRTAAEEEAVIYARDSKEANFYSDPNDFRISLSRPHTRSNMKSRGGLGWEEEEGLMNEKGNLLMGPSGMARTLHVLPPVTKEKNGMWRVRTPWDERWGPGGDISAEIGDAEYKDLFTVFRYGK